MSPLFTSVSSSSLLFSYVAEREFSVCSAPTRCFGGGKRYSCVSRTPRFKRQKAISCCQRQITDAAYPLPLILQYYTSSILAIVKCLFRLIYASLDELDDGCLHTVQYLFLLENLFQSLTL